MVLVRQLDDAGRATAGSDLQTNKSLQALSSAALQLIKCVVNTHRQCAEKHAKPQELDLNRHLSLAPMVTHANAAGQARQIYCNALAASSLLMMHPHNPLRQHLTALRLGLIMQARLTSHDQPLSLLQQCSRKWSFCR